jgi:hypothetical protein
MTQTNSLSSAYLNDAPFWYLLVRRMYALSEEELPSLFDSLNRRSESLGLPIVFSGVKALSWAVACRLFVLYDRRASVMGRTGYLRMVNGSKQAFGHGRFAAVAFKRLVANITYPSSPDRTVRESVADTFLANGLTVTEEYNDSSWDDVILSRSLADAEMMALCDRIITPPAGLWEDVVANYGRHRPGYFSRVVFNLKSWLLS